MVRGMGKIMKTNVLAATVAAVLLLTGCGGSDEPAPSLQTLTPSPTPEPTETPTETPEPPAPDGTAANPYDFGVLVPSAVGSMWNVTITEPVLDGNDTVRAESQFNEFRDGWQYVMGRMTTVVNEDLRPETVGSPVDVTSIMPLFIGSDGKIYEIWNDDGGAVLLSEDWIGQPSIIGQVGVTSTGRFAIQVPSSAVEGGRFAVYNNVTGDILFFGPAQ